MKKLFLVLALALVSAAASAIEIGQVRAFTPDHHFMSADCRHLSKGGADYFAARIDWNKYMKNYKR